MRHSHCGYARSAFMSGALLLGAAGCQNDIASPNERTGATPQAAVSAMATLEFSQLSAGNAHTCGVTTDSRAYCWGNNSNGQIGNGRIDDSEFGNPQFTPALVEGGLSIKQVDAGTYHTCAVTTTNRAYCWGEGGLLGTGTTTRELTPTPVAGTHSFRQVSAGTGHTCAVATDSRAYCWGKNESGELGDGTTTPRLTPVSVLGGLSFREVSAGGRHTCGVTTDGRAFCWGYNQYGQVGDSSGAWKRLRPVRVTGTRQYSRISAGISHTCAVTTSDRAFCWGSNTYGKIGDGTTTQRRWPRAVAGGLSLNRVSAGGNHTCAINTGNRAYCWGRGQSGQVGDGTTSNRLKPVAVAGNSYFRQLTTGGDHTCAKNNLSAAYCWGADDWAQLGDADPTFIIKTTPTPVAEPGASSSSSSVAINAP
jgi:alpha-tubulin suppressor-like RCC1 family protein